MIGIALAVLKTTLLLGAGALCVASPETVQRAALEVGRRRGLSDEWRDGMLSDEFLWSIRLSGGVLIALAGLLALALLRGPA